MRLPQPEKGKPLNLSEWARQIESADKQNYKRNANLDVPDGSYVVLTSPDGTRWGLTVDDTGVLGTTAL